MLGAHYPHVTVATILDNAHRDQLHQHLVLWEKGKSSTKFLQTPPLSAVVQCCLMMKAKALR